MQVLSPLMGQSVLARDDKYQDKHLICDGLVLYLVGVAPLDGQVG